MCPAPRAELCALEMNFIGPHVAPSRHLRFACHRSGRRECLESPGMPRVLISRPTEVEPSQVRCRDVHHYADGWPVARSMSCPFRTRPRLSLSSFFANAWQPPLWRWTGRERAGAGVRQCAVKLGLHNNGAQGLPRCVARCSDQARTYA